MQPASLAEWVSQVIEVHGRKAPMEAARQAAMCEKYGKARIAEAWRQVAMEIEKRPAARVH